MDLLEAKAIFKIQNKYSQAELDAFYGFEKNLLLQRLSDEATEEELKEAQDALSNLERAYSVLSIELTSPSNSEESTHSEKSDKPPVNPIVIGLGIGALCAAAAFHFLNQPSTPEPNTPITPITDNAVSTEITIPPKEDKEKIISSKNYKLSRNAQESSMMDALKYANLLKSDWEELVEGADTQLPQTIAKTYEEGEDLRSTERYSQAQLAYETFTKDIKKHIQLYTSYQSVFNKFNQLESKWSTLAKANNFQLSQNDRYSRQFNTVKKELDQGIIPSHSKGTLEQICFTYEKTIQRGKNIAKQHQSYLSLKQQWKSRVLNSGYYVLTPSIKEMITTADSKPRYAEDFEYLETKVYPRLINHFKQHLKKAR